MARQCDGKLEDALRLVQDLIRERSTKMSSSAAETKRALVEPVLDALGWDLSDPRRAGVGPYDEAAARRAAEPDYVLVVDGVEWAFVRVAPLYYVDDAEVDVEEACGRDTPCVGVATDGQTWKVWRDGSWTGADIGTDGACGLLSGISAGRLNGDYEREKEAAVRELAGRFRGTDPAPDQVRIRENANRAAGLFAAEMADNKIRYRDDADIFRGARRVYLNILMYAESKTAIREALDGIDGLDGGTKDEIIRLSVPGKFLGMGRALHERADGEYRTGFLELVEAFAGRGGPYGRMMDRFEAFAARMRARNTLSLTGLLSALQPGLFMPYTKRSATPFRDTLFDHLCDVDICQYRKFNDLYGRISGETGMTLVELDAVANQWYVDGG